MKKVTSALLLILSFLVMSFSMLFTPVGFTTTNQTEITDNVPSTQEEFVEKYAERLLDDVPAAELMDPALREFMESGYLAEDIVTTNDNSIKIVLFLSPTADYTAVKQVVDVNWRMDLKAMQVISTSVDSALDLKKLEAIDGVNYISADTYLTKTVIDDSAPEMFEINDVVGRYGTSASSYDGFGIVVGIDDDGVDFSLPDMKDAQYIDGDGNPGDFDPSGWGITEMVAANYSYVADVNAWLSEGNLLTYVNGSKTYLNVTGWDPVCNNNGLQRYLMGLREPYGDGYPEGPNVGFIGLYEYSWGINNVSEFVYNEMWKDWEIPGGATENYTFGWAFQQRQDDYAKVFVPSMIYEDEIVIDWNGTQAWNYMWNYAIWIKYDSGEGIDLNVQGDRDWITDMMDWSFADDFNDGYVYGVGTGNNPILSADIDNDGNDDIGVGSLTWAYDGFGYLSAGIDDFFCGITDDNMAWAAMFNSEGIHGTQTASAIGSRGVIDHEDIWRDGRVDSQKLPGIANGSKIIAVKGLTSGDDLGAQFWAAGFHLGADGNFSYTTTGEKHKADIISNSWGYVNGAYLTLTYLTMAWDLMSVPNVINESYAGTLFLVSSGNSGPDYMTNGAPDSAFSVISVGGTIVTHAYNDLYEDGQLQLNQQAWFSSNGPSFTGNVKPDIIAPSVFGRSPTPFTNTWLEIDDSSSWWSGTSLACPITAGGVALVLEALKSENGAGWYDPQVLKDIVLSTASDIGVDGFIQGNGLLDIDAAIYAVENGGYAYQSDSFANYADIINDGWEFWIPDWNPFEVWFDESLDTPVGLESSSIFFGNVYRSGSYDVDLTIYDPNAFGSTFLLGEFDTVVPTYYSMNQQFIYDIETRAHNDTNLYYQYRGDVVDITALMSAPELIDFMNAPYVTITAGFDVDDIGIGMRVWDYADTMANGVTNYWYNSTLPGDYIQWISRDTSNCNNLIADYQVQAHRVKWTICSTTHPLSILAIQMQTKLMVLT